MTQLNLFGIEPPTIPNNPWATSFSRRIKKRLKFSHKRERALHACMMAKRVFDESGLTYIERPRAFLFRGKHKKTHANYHPTTGRWIVPHSEQKIYEGGIQAFIEWYKNQLKVML
jgi:hypothetical protein